MFSNFFTIIIWAGISQRKSNRGHLGWLFCSSDNYYKIIENEKCFLRKCRGCKNVLKFCGSANILTNIYLKKYQCEARDRRIETKHIKTL